MCGFFEQGVSEASLSVVADGWAGYPVFGLREIVLL